MTIYEAILKYKEITNTDLNCPGYCNVSCDKCVQESIQLSEWLEELKRRREYDGEIIGSGALNNAYNQGYNKAIDDSKSVILQTLDNEILVDTLHLRLERLKEGAGNDKSI